MVFVKNLLSLIQKENKISLEVSFYDQINSFKYEMYGMCT